jgi:hypothetical protein
MKIALNESKWEMTPNFLIENAKAINNSITEA